MEDFGNKLAVFTGSGKQMATNLVNTFTEHSAVLKPFLDICSETLSACYPDMYGDDKHFDLVKALENDEMENLDPALLGSVGTISQLADFFVHMKNNGKGIDDMDSLFSSLSGDREGLLSAITCAASASDSEFGENARQTIKASILASNNTDGDIAKEWSRNGIKFPSLRMSVIAGEDGMDLRETDGDLTSRVASLVSGQSSPTWKKVYEKSAAQGITGFGANHVDLKGALSAAVERVSGIVPEMWQLDSCGQGGCLWIGVGITDENSGKLLAELQQIPACMSLDASFTKKYANVGDLLHFMANTTSDAQTHRDGWEWSDVNWVMVGLMFSMHAFALWGTVLLWSHPLFYTMWAQAWILYPVTGMLGITAGAHRLWSHRSYSAHFPARALMMIFNSIANQSTIYHWARDHRVHHAKSDTEADPHDITRGFFYAHMGWLLLKKAKAVKIAGKEIDCADLLKDPCVWIQHVCDPWWNLAWSFGMPTAFWWYMYDEALLGFLVLGAARWLLCLHATWCVNSVAHTMGPRPYEASMYPTESWFTTIVAVGEGWHNWHHTYPYDYSASELGFMSQVNPTTMWIDFLALIGQAYGRKKATNKKKVQ